MTIKHYLYCFISGWFCLILVACSPQNTAIPLSTPTHVPPTLIATPSQLPATPTVIAPTATFGIPTATRFPFPSLARIRMVDDLNCADGWAITSDTGQLLRTEDGGVHWKNVLSEIEVRNPGSAFILNEQAAWVVVDGKLYRTHNGGSNWESFSVPFNGGTLYFSNASDGWVEADPDCGAGTCYLQLLQTTDGGRTWELMSVSNPEGNQEDLPIGTVHILSSDRFQFTHSSTLWYGGNRMTESTYADLWVSRDNGRNWQHIQKSLPGLDQNIISPVWVDLPIFMNDTDGYFSAKYYLPDKNGGDPVQTMAVFTTRDGGWNWFARTRILPGVDAMAHIDFIDEMNAFIQCGENLCFTNDGALTWEIIQSNLRFMPEGNFELIGFDFASIQTGWVIVTRGDGVNGLYKTINGGKTWNEMLPQLIK